PPDLFGLRLHAHWPIQMARSSPQRRRACRERIPLNRCVAHAQALAPRDFGRESAPAGTTVTLPARTASPLQALHRAIRDRKRDDESAAGPDSHYPEDRPWSAAATSVPDSNPFFEHL